MVPRLEDSTSAGNTRLWIAWASVVFAQCLCATAQVQAPQLQDLLGSLVDFDQVYFPTVSPFIVVATISSNEPVGTPTEAARFPGVALQLRRVTCMPENVLRGPVPEKPLIFYYFADVHSTSAQRNPIHRQLFQAEIGGRYMLFLTKEHAVYRSIGDVGRYTISVFSGAHPQGAENDEPSGIFNYRLGAAIADVLLTPGVQFEPDKFAAKIYEARLTADRLGSMLHTVSLLKNLLKQVPSVRAAACLELAHSYYGQYGCLYDLQSDVDQPDQIRKQAATQLQDQIRLNGILRKQLADPAHLGFGILLRPDSLNSNLEELQLMLSHPEPDLRRLACGAIKRYFPAQWREGCE